MKISKDFGIVIRRQALEEKSINLAPVLLEFHFDGFYDQSPAFVSLGPFFGGDASDSCIKILEKLGLSYIDDFFVLEAYIPDWCRIEVFTPTPESEV
ncbi:hypothetical protein [Ottowia sp.]|uniref:hypothetical protein n=1 Tax=Ottowia sp. TaxID=1898956 RepID=UPI0039E2BEE7